MKKDGVVIKTSEFEFEFARDEENEETFHLAVFERKEDKTRGALTASAIMAIEDIKEVQGGWGVSFLNKEDGKQLTERLEKARLDLLLKGARAGAPMINNLDAAISELKSLTA